MYSKDIMDITYYNDAFTEDSVLTKNPKYYEIVLLLRLTCDGPLQVVISDNLIELEWR